MRKDAVEAYDARLAFRALAAVLCAGGVDGRSVITGMLAALIELLAANFDNNPEKVAAFLAESARQWPEYGVARTGDETKH